MLKNIKYKIAGFFFPEYMKSSADVMQAALKVKTDTENIINQRVAETLAKMDPFEPLMKEYNGIFSIEYQHPEDQLNEQGKVGMYMWGWQQKNDMHFTYMIDYIMNTAGNAILKRGNPIPERILYARAQIANMVLLRKEVGRLSSNYEEMLKRGKGDEFDDGVAVE